MRMCVRNIRYNISRMSEDGIRAGVLKKRIMSRKDKAPLFLMARISQTPVEQQKVLSKISHNAHAYRALRRLFDDAQRFNSGDVYHLCVLRDVMHELFGKDVTLRQAESMSAMVAAHHQRIIEQKGASLGEKEALGCRLMQEAMTSLHQLLRVPAYRSVLFEKKFEHWGSFHLVRVGIPLVVGVGLVALGCAHVPFICKFVVTIFVGTFTNEARKYIERTWTHKDAPRCGLFAWALQKTYRVDAIAMPYDGQEVPQNAR